MPFVNDPIATGPLSLPKDFDLSPDDPDIDTSAGSVIGASFRLENPVVSMFSGFEYDRSKPFDPEYYPTKDIQGTVYEQYSDRFVHARDADDVASMKGQIDRERADRSVIEAAGGWGLLAEISAGILSPTSLLPGGAVVKGIKGVQIGKTAMSVSLAAGAAVAIDEAFLQYSQETRTGLESGLAIGGGLILGGLLGGAVGGMTRKAYTRTVNDIEQLPEAINDVNEALRSVGAAEVPRSEMKLREETLFQALNKIPILRGVVRTDPLLRAQLSSNVEVRRALVGLVETVLQYKDNELGQSVMDHVVGSVSAETAIKTRRNVELAGSLSYLQKSFGEYVNDGPVGLVGRFTAPITVRYQNLLNADRKLTSEEFMREVGKAAMAGDTHPIPQVQAAAQQIRKNFFNKAKQDLIDLGVFDEALQLKYADSYLTRVYNTKKISANLGSGSTDDLMVTLFDQFKVKRSEAEIRLAQDPTVRNLESDVFGLKQQIRQAQSAFEKATKKAKSKAGRAKAAIKREGAVGRVTASLRKEFERRSKGLSKKTLQGDDRAAFAQMVKNAKRVDKMEPPDILAAIRQLGGIKDDGTGELAAALDDKLLSIKRNDGMNADDMRAALTEMGYLDEGMTVNEFYDAMRSSAGGEKVYSRQEFGPEIEAYEAALEFRNALDEAGIDISTKSIDEIMDELPEFARDQKTTRAKAAEAGRSAGKAASKTDASNARVLKAIDRLEDAEARLAELDEIVSPKVRAEIKAAREELANVIPELKKAKKAQSADEYYASLDDLEIEEAVLDTVNSIIGLKPGQHSYTASASSPTRARVLDVADEFLEPWLETDMGVILGQYFHSVIPAIEVTKRFGDIHMTKAIDDINREMHRMIAKAETEKEVKAITAETKIRRKEMMAMRDRVLGTYGVPNDPDSGWVRGFRSLRTVSYMGYLGGMTLAALPDVAGVVGRNGIEAAFGATTALTDPKRAGLAAREAMEDFGSAADWWLNGRQMSMAEVMDPYGSNTSFERGLGKISSGFTTATGMTAWNAGWKSINAAISASKMSKAALAVVNGNATKVQLIKLGENGINPEMAARIAKQVQEFGDMDGHLWLPKGGEWTDKEAFELFRHAMTREMDIAIITPGQDKPLAFSNETGKFFSQFKTFTASAHHRILLSGIQRHDAAILAQVTTAVLLGGLVSNIKADLGGFDRKEGGAFWVDAIDRAGLSGWLFETHNIVNSLSGGKLGEEVSRYRSRSAISGLMGPSVGMASDVFTGVSAMGRGDSTFRDSRKVMRPLPGNNLPYLLGLTRQIEDALTDMTGGKPRPQ